MFLRIYQTQEECLSDIQTLRSETVRCSQDFLTNFEVFGYPMKRAFECLI